MKIVNFEALDGSERVGALDPADSDRIIDLQGAFIASLVASGTGEDEATAAAHASVPSHIDAFIVVGPDALEAARQALAFAAAETSMATTKSFVMPESEVRLRPPISHANSLRDFLAFEDHARAGAERRSEDLNPIWYERPIYYKGNHRSIIGPGDDILRPAFTKELDFEMEIACIVGTRGRDLDETEAEAAIFGFTIMNDWSARDVQRKEMAARLGPAKSKDFATSLGPCIITADEIGAQPSLEMTARLNGRVVCRANLGQAHWSFARMISFVSEGEDVWPTDIYGSGTPRGGCLLDHGAPYLEPGDVVELEVEGIGILRNRVVD